MEIKPLGFRDLYTETPKTIFKEHNNWVLFVIWSLDSKYIISGDYNAIIIIWSVETCNKCFILKGHKKWITSLSCRPMNID